MSSLIEMATVVRALEKVRGKPALTSNQCFDLAMAIRAELAAAPQPPANLQAKQDDKQPVLGGEPETLAYLVRDSRDGQYSAHRRDPRGWAHGYQIKELIDRASLAPYEAEIERLTAMLDTPHTADWFEGVRLEAGHQIKRWGTEHDAGKTPADWFWLIGYLSQKAMTAHMSGDETQARHHTISTGAALLNWFRAIVGDSNAMRPGIDAALNKPAGVQS